MPLLSTRACTRATVYPIHIYDRPEVKAKWFSMPANHDSAGCELQQFMVNAMTPFLSSSLSKESYEEEVTFIAPPRPAWRTASFWLKVQSTFVILFAGLLLAPSSPSPITLRSRLTPLDHFAAAWKLTAAKLDRKPLPPGHKYPTIKPSDVCVMSADTRPFEAFVGPDSYSEPQISDAETMEYWDASAYYNMFWALRHGYKYKRVQAEMPKDRHFTWAKVPALQKISAECEWTVFFDGDAWVTNPQYSLQELVHHFGFHDKASMLVARDIPDADNPLNQNATNTGFIILRRGQLTKTILERMMVCPDVIDGCDKFKKSFPHEQGVFNHYIRPTLVEGENLILASCPDANGYWAWQHEDWVPKEEYCLGHLITHDWHEKTLVTRRLENIAWSELVKFLQKTFDGQSTREIDTF